MMAQWKCAGTFALVSTDEIRRSFLFLVSVEVCVCVTVYVCASVVALKYSQNNWLNDQQIYINLQKKELHFFMFAVNVRINLNVFLGEATS